MYAQRNRTSGFTLVELMIVVVILSVLAVALAPSVSRSVLEQRSGATAREVVRVVREARLRAMSQRRAHLVHIDGTRIRVLRGANNSCSMADWVAINQLCDERNASRVAGTECLNVELGQKPWSISGSGLVRLQEMSDVVVDVDEGTTAERGDIPHRVLCYAPSGAVYHGSSLGGVLLTGNSVGGGFLFQVDMMRESETDQTAMVPARRVLVPLNGFAKVLR